MLWTILAVMVALYAVGKLATGESFLVAIGAIALALVAANVIASLYVARQGGFAPNGSDRRPEHPVR